MINKKKYISLKEASEISGYSPDYIGYLIRNGKIEGRPVFTNIAWQTTAEAILSYKNRERGRKKKSNSKFQRTKFLLVKSVFKNIFLKEIKLIFLFFKYFKKQIIIFSIIVILFIIFGFILFEKTYYNNFTREINKEQVVQDNQVVY